jgi:hypothetical protein
LKIQAFNKKVHQNKIHPSHRIIKKYNFKMKKTMMMMMIIKILLMKNKKNIMKREKAFQSR